MHTNKKLIYFTLSLILIALGFWQINYIGSADVDEALLLSQWWLIILTILIIGGTWYLIINLTSAYEKIPQHLKGKYFILASLPMIIFTILGLHVWQVIIVGFKVPIVLLPAPSDIYDAIVSNRSLLWQDFVQTVIKSVIPGFVIGCGLAIIIACLAWRYPKLGHSWLVLGNFMSVLPIVGVAPIMVMWFGFDWQSKAAVAALMTFFPMLVNALAGFSVASSLERDLIYTYATTRWVYFRKLILPAALPFLFNGFKVCSTLALIGAIVAEFFGTPIVGMGFRISSEIGRMSLDVVWASIVVSAIVGTSMYGLILFLEKTFTFWDASWQQK